jgi:hypothetical protein
VEIGIKGRRLYGTYADEIVRLFQDKDLMSHASQRDCASETGSATADDDKTDLERCLLRGFMGTRLDT